MTSVKGCALSVEQKEGKTRKAQPSTRCALEVKNFGDKAIKADGLL